MNSSIKTALIHIAAKIKIKDKMNKNNFNVFESSSIQHLNQEKQQKRRIIITRNKNRYIIKSILEKS